MLRSSWETWAVTLMVLAAVSLVVVPCHAGRRGGRSVLSTLGSFQFHAGNRAGNDESTMESTSVLDNSDLLLQVGESQPIASQMREECLSLAKAIELRSETNATSNACTDDEFKTFKVKHHSSFTGIGSEKFDTKLRDLKTGASMTITPVAGSGKAAYDHPMGHPPNDHTNGYGASATFVTSGNMGVDNADGKVPYYMPATIPAGVISENGISKWIIAESAGQAHTGLREVTLQGPMAGLVISVTKGCNVNSQNHSVVAAHRQCASESEPEKVLKCMNAGKMLTNSIIRIPYCNPQNALAVRCSTGVKNQHVGYRNEGCSSGWKLSDIVGLTTFKDDAGIFKAVVASTTNLLYIVDLTGDKKGQVQHLSGETNLCKTKKASLSDTDGNKALKNIDVESLCPVPDDGTSFQDGDAKNARYKFEKRFYPMVAFEDKDTKYVLILDKHNDWPVFRKVAVSGNKIGSVRTLRMGSDPSCKEMWDPEKLAPDARSAAQKNQMCSMWAVSLNTKKPNNHKVDSLGGAVAYTSGKGVAMAILTVPNLKKPDRSGVVYSLVLSGDKFGEIAPLQCEGGSISGGRCTKHVASPVHVAVTPGQKTAYVYSPELMTVSKIGSIDGPGPYNIQEVSKVKVPFIKAVTMIDMTTLAYLDNTGVHFLDMSQKISCKEEAWLPKSLDGVAVEKLGRAEVYRKYESGVHLKSSDGVWSFTAYKRQSITKSYDGTFHFTKNLVCFHLCTPGVEEGKCTEEHRVGQDRCCVSKEIIEGDAETATPCELRWANEELKRRGRGHLKREDGMKVF